MTPEQRAAKIRLDCDWPATDISPGSWGYLQDEIVTAIRAALDEQQAKHFEEMQRMSELCGRLQKRLEILEPGD